MTEPDEKTRRLLAVALEVFARHGFRKTSMQDIADAAGISRAALYLRFRNKEDVFRSGSAVVHADMPQRTRAAFATRAAFPERLRQALLAFTVGLLEPLDTGGHGQELFGANTALAADISADTAAELRALIRSELVRAAATGEIALPPACSADELADLLYTVANGLKHSGDHAAMLGQRIDLFVALLPPALAVTRRRAGGKPGRR
jgi:AcrR family transcriptional regulator